MTQNRDRKAKIRARMAATGEPYAEASRAISSRFAGTGDDFLADRHADLDAGEDGAGMTDADYDDRISDSTETDALAWSGPDWYAFPPEPPQGTALGLGNGRNQRYYWEARRRWAPWQVRQHARMAAELTGGRARHLADWYPEGWAPYHGSTRDLALELLYVITLHDWPDLVPDPARLAALAAAGDRPFHAWRASHPRRDAVQLARRLPARDRSQLPRPGRPRAGRGTAVRVGAGRRAPRPLRPGLVPGQSR